jgi:hypothetical protein
VVNGGNEVGDWVSKGSYGKVVVSKKTRSDDGGL